MPNDLQTIIATGFSMWPVIHPGDIIFYHSVSTVRCGDILLYLDETGQMICHRLIKRKNGLLWLKGDATPRNDAPIAPERLIGCVKQIEHKGRLLPLEQGYRGLIGKICRLTCGRWLIPSLYRAVCLLKMRLFFRRKI